MDSFSRGRIEGAFSVLSCRMAHKPLELDEETIEALKELGRVLRAVHERLIGEGYRFVDGKYVPPGE